MVGLVGGEGPKAAWRSRLEGHWLGLARAVLWSPLLDLCLQAPPLLRWEWHGPEGGGGPGGTRTGMDCTGSSVGLTGVSGQTRG